MNDKAAGLVFRKSSFSNGQGGNCVEVAVTEGGGRAVRHSKHPEGEVIFYSREEWDAFLAGAKAGEFDE